MKYIRNKENRIFYLLLGAAILGSLIQTALNTALPPIMKDLGISADTAQWLISAYTLVSGIMVLTTAFFIRRFSARRLYLAAIGIFCIGLLCSACALNFPILLLGRILQGIATAITVSLTQVVILTIFSVEKRGAKMGAFGLASCAAPVLAPTVAGIIVDCLGWRMIFGASLAVALILFVYGFGVMEDVTIREDAQFDMLSLLLCSLAFTGIVLGLGNRKLILIVTGVILLVIFAYRQLHQKTPFLNIRVFVHKNFRIAVFASMLMYAAMIAASTLLPLYNQTICGYSATISGLITMPGSLITAAISPLAGKIYDKVGIRRLYLVGSGCLLLGHICMSFLKTTTPISLVILFFCLRQAGIGLIMMPTVTWGMKQLKKEEVADGTALINSLRTIAGSIGSAVFVSVMTIVSEQEGASVTMNGIKVAFIGMVMVVTVLLFLAVFWIKDRN